ncbi:MAG TPA: hypothetical protein VF103_00900 [Polyangiaceae bacterium]
MDGEVVVRKYSAPHEAELSANYLREHEIRARVDNDVLPQMDPFYSDVFGGVRLHVRQRDAERADELLRELEALEKAARAERDPTTVADRTADRALVGAVLGILLPIVTHALSLWLALRVDWHALSRRGRRRMTIAVVIDLVAFGIAGLAVAYA